MGAPEGVDKLSWTPCFSKDTLRIHRPWGSGLAVGLGRAAGGSCTAVHFSPTGATSRHPLTPPVQLRQVAVRSSLSQDGGMGGFTCSFSKYTAQRRRGARIRAASVSSRPGGGESAAPAAAALPRYRPRPGPGRLRSCASKIGASPRPPTPRAPRQALRAPQTRGIRGRRGAPPAARPRAGSAADAGRRPDGDRRSRPPATHVTGSGGAGPGRSRSRGRGPGARGPGRGARSGRSAAGKRGAGGPRVGAGA